MHFVFADFLCAIQSMSGSLHCPSNNPIPSVFFSIQYINDFRASIAQNCLELKNHIGNVALDAKDSRSLGMR